MARGKLILICQSRGEFVKSEDGSMSYNGGEAHAVDINSETLFDDLKSKLAEMWNLEYNSLSIKYFLPGNRRTLITLSNDKDLKRMYDFHGSSITADVFVKGRAGFDCEAFKLHSRAGGLKLAETVPPVAGFTASTAAHHAVAAPAVAVYTTTAPITINADSSVVPATVAVAPAAPLSLPVETLADSIISVKATVPNPIGATVSSLSSGYIATHNPDAAYSSPAGFIAVATDALLTT
ncbi:hypothetical protein CJ030_MR0G020843 [Morella rubra]|uniref:PB1 domain-containing protein n=1 Tax=Morella rubra TaxID=262757 RepID=A0A6A1UH02_9ROSI|nr:hypothetical protein CJ030_MR0G020843 [Morella rubra]